MKFLLVLTFFTAALAGDNIVNLASDNLQLTISLFKDFSSKMDRHYAAGEGRKRLAIFRNSIKEAAKLNAEESDVEYGITLFSDMTASEAELMMGLNATEADVEDIPVLESTSVPLKSSSSWKSLFGPVKDQGRTNACWAFTSTAVLEGWTARYNRRYTALSEQETADCTPGATIARGGWNGRALDSIRKQNHLTSARYLPFTSRDGTCTTRYPNYLPFSITRVQSINSDRSQAYALNSGPVAAAIRFGRTLQLYKRGIFTNTACNRDSVNHAVTVIGYASSYYEIRNSYGDRWWGERGYGKISRGSNNLCNISGRSYSITTRRNGQEEEE